VDYVFCWQTSGRGRHSVPGGQAVRKNRVSKLSALGEDFGPASAVDGTVDTTAAEQ
jgi:hypothetical protein